MTCDGRRPLMEDNLCWKTTFVGRQPLMEGDLWWKVTFDGRQPLMEDNFDGTQHLMEDNLWWKTTFDGRRPLVEEDLQWKTTFDGRRPFFRTLNYFRPSLFGQKSSRPLPNLCTSSPTLLGTNFCFQLECGSTQPDLFLIPSLTTSHCWFCSLNYPYEYVRVCFSYHRL